MLFRFFLTIPMFFCAFALISLTLGQITPSKINGLTPKNGWLIKSAYANQNKNTAHPVLFYQISGGIAGICNKIYIYENGDAGHTSTCSDTPKTYSPDKNSVKELVAYLDNVPHAYSTSWFYIFSQDKEPECCDQFTIIMNYKGKVVHFSRLSEDEQTALNKKLDAIMPNNN